MKKDKLTTEEVQLMETVKNEWINIYNNNTSFNDKSVIEGVEWVYEFSGLKKPQVLIMDNPMECQLLANILSNVGVSSNVWNNVWDNVWNNVGNNVENNVGDNVRNNVRNNVRDNVRDNVGDNVEDNVWNNVGDNVRDNVWNNVRDNVEDNVWNNVGDNVRDNVRDNVENTSELRYFFTSFYLSYRDSGWCSFYDYFTRIGVLNNEDFNKYLKLVKNGIYYSILLDGVAIISRPPTEVNQNEEGQLHNVDNYAIKFKNYAFCSVRGMNIPDDIFVKVKDNKLTLEEFFSIDNEETKSAILAMIEELRGNEGVYQFFKENLTMVSEYVDKKEDKYLEGTTRGQMIGVYSLFKGTINNEEVAYVRCYCPSTDRMFFLGVDPVHSEVKNAIASLYRVPVKLVDHIKSISRQGERFCTQFSEEGKSKLKGLSKEDLSDFANIPGDKYFELMSYEY